MKKIILSILILTVFLSGCSSKECVGLECLAEASEDCIPTKATYDAKKNVLGAKQVLTASYELVQVEDPNDCRVSFEVLDIQSEYSESLKKLIVSSGASDDQVENLAEKKDETISSIIGTEGYCEGSREDISSMLYNWHLGKFFSSDLSKLSCEGNYFENLEKYLLKLENSSE